MSWHHLILVFLVGLGSNIIGCRFGYAVAHRELPIVLLLGILLPLMQSINSAFFIAAETKAQRAKIAMTNGVATAAAGAVVTLFLTH
jgi:hypothetical protein